MADLQRIRVISSGYPGGPGVTTYYALNAAAALPAIKGLTAEMAVSMPSIVRFEYPTAGDTIDPVTGALTGAWTADARDDDSGTQLGGYAAPVGVCINWLTGVVVDGHRLKGRTFFVPMAEAAFDLEGSIAAASLVAMRGTVNAHQAAMEGNLVIWHRPVHATLAGPPAHVGAYAPVSSGNVPDKAVILKSRRD